VNELKWLIIALIILLFLIILIIFTKITIYLNYYHYKDDDNLKIEFRIWFGLIRYKKNIPLIKVDDHSPSIIVKETENGNGDTNQDDENVRMLTAQKLINTLKNFREILEHVFQLNNIIKKFFKRVTVKRFEWNSIIGLGDAVHSGMAAGALWAIKGGILGLLSHYLRLKEMPRLMVQPHFQQMITHTELTCIFQFRIGHAMLAGLKLVKLWKGGPPHLKQNNLMSNDKSI
jgi:hypothetical protein